MGYSMKNIYPDKAKRLSIPKLIPVRRRKSGFASSSKVENTVESDSLSDTSNDLSSDTPPSKHSPADMSFSMTDRYE
jgi:hypothetical protein